MGQIKWYKRDPERALNGMMGLSLEERGAYNTVLDLIYHREGNLPDDERFVAGYMGVDVRVWRRIKKRLIDLGKLEIRDSKLTNEMADEVLHDALRRVTSARDAGIISAASKANKSDPEGNKNRDIGSTGVGTGAATGVPTIKNKSKKEEPSGSSSPCSPPSDQEPKRKQKTGVNPDWRPAQFGQTSQCRGIVDGWPPGELENQIERFIANHQARGTRFENWQAAWQTWVLNSVEFSRNRNGTGNGKQSPRNGGPKPKDGFERAIDRRLDIGDDEDFTGASERRADGGGFGSGEMQPARIVGQR